MKKCEELYLFYGIRVPDSHPEFAGFFDGSDSRIKSAESEGLDTKKISDTHPEYWVVGRKLFEFTDGFDEFDYFLNDDKLSDVISETKIKLERTGIRGDIGLFTIMDFFY